MSYARSAFGLIDLLAILPWYLALLLPGNSDWLSALYLLRVLKVARFTPALSLFVAVLRAESGPLLSTLMILGVLMVLEAGQIAEIAHLLRRRVVPARYAVVRRGEPADAMYFILTGQVEVDVPPTPKRLGPGDYFGEIALVNDTLRTATVTTLDETELCVLDVGDFRRLLAARPEVRGTIMATAAARQAEDAAAALAHTH